MAADKDSPRATTEDEEAEGNNLTRRMGALENSLEDMERRLTQLDRWLAVHAPSITNISRSIETEGEARGVKRKREGDWRDSAPHAKRVCG